MIHDRWRKSSFSGGDNNNCVELNLAPAISAIRDSKNPTGPVLTLTPTAWSALLHTTKHA
ncbi:hypothetical protein [Alloactinosynnema sp. L-07]|uniref:DUF397 domain-containing protein n=1 Tax=Alloactinosynnema sp. L-07 TaxID=1653480 RepID=UPI00065EFC64|nr:DUF397 domain-containing protein [Alloactinosynnema sp. L-07]CRK61208.1 hypothetical protein [Alloactinosynnema sp. L-07]